MKIRKKFTLLELLVVIAILAIIAALLMPMFIRARTKARMANDVGNLKQVYLAIVNYSMDNDGSMPFMKDLEEGDHQSKNLWMLLPYIGYNTRILMPSFEQMNGYAIYSALNTDPESTPFPEFAYSPVYENPDDKTDTSIMSFKLNRPPFPLISTYNRKYDTLIIINSTGEVDFATFKEE